MSLDNLMPLSCTNCGNIFEKEQPYEDICRHVNGKCKETPIGITINYGYSARSEYHPNMLLTYEEFEKKRMMDMSRYMRTTDGFHVDVDSDRGLESDMKFIPGKYYKLNYEGRSNKALYVGNCKDEVYDLVFFIEDATPQDKQIFRIQSNSLIAGSAVEWCDHPSVVSNPIGFFCDVCKEKVEFTFAEKEKPEHQNMACLVMNCQTCKDKPKKIEKIEKVVVEKEGEIYSIHNLATTLNKLIDAVNELRDK